jgi:hypothetical protein
LWCTDIIKTLISEKDKLLERKTIDAVFVSSFHRLIFASNHDHPLRIDALDRRFVGYEVKLPEDMTGPDPDAVARRVGYFGEVATQMDNGGRAALLHMLLERDISKLIRRRSPRPRSC